MEAFLILLIFALGVVAIVWKLLKNRPRHRWAGRWLRLPENIRRGLLRLYFATAVPWVAWFGYQILDALDQHPYNAWRYVSGHFWRLLIVPLGGPISLWIVLWVLDGFRKSGQEVGLGESTQEGTAACSPSPSRKSYPSVTVMQSSKDRGADNGSGSLRWAG